MEESLELRIERIKRISNLELDMLQCFYDRQPIVERYAKGEIGIHIHFRFSGCAYCAVYVSREAVKLTNRAYLNDVFSNIDYWSEKPMLVRVRDKRQTMSPISSLVGLQILNNCDMFDAESFQVGRTPSLETRWLMFDRKLRIILFNTGVEKGQLVNKVIQGGAQVIGDFANKNAPSGRGNILDSAKSAYAQISL